MSFSRKIQSSGAVKVLANGILDLEGSGSYVKANELQLTTKLAVAQGGHGASTAEDARANLGLAIGSNVQAYHAKLADVAGLAPSSGQYLKWNGSNFVADTPVGTNYDADEVTLQESSSVFSIKDLGVASAKLADGAVVEAKLGSGAVVEAKIGSGAVVEAKLGSGAVTEAKIGTGAVTSAKLGADCVTSSKIADNAVDSEHIIAGAIDEAHLSSGCVTDAKLGSGAVSTSKLASNAVETAKIADNNVTEAKLASAFLTSVARTTASYQQQEAGQSGSMKQQLYEAQSTDATAFNLADFALPTDSVVAFDAIINCCSSDMAHYASFRLHVAGKNDNGTSYMANAQQEIVHNSSTMTCVLDLSGNNIRVRCAGVNSMNLRWNCRLVSVVTPKYA